MTAGELGHSHSPTQAHMLKLAVVPDRGFVALWLLLLCPKLWLLIVPVTPSLGGRDRESKDLLTIPSLAGVAGF